MEILCFEDAKPLNFPLELVLTGALLTDLIILDDITRSCVYGMHLSLIHALDENFHHILDNVQAISVRSYYWTLGYCIITRLV